MEKNWVKFFSEINSNDVNLVGSKGANLGELVQAGFSIPPGFCVTTDAYDSFLEINKILTPIAELSNSIDGGSVLKASKQIREIIANSIIPDDLLTQIVDAIKEIGKDNFYAIRSSATGEDLPDASFAGQLESYLNVHGEAEILNKIRDCWASLYTERAMLYRIEKKYMQEKVRMAVVVQSMIFSEKSGVMFTADPITGNRHTISINASYGLGEAIVSGIVSADLYQVNKNNLSLLKNISRKDSAIYPVKNSSGGVKKENLSDEIKRSQALGDNKIIELAKIGKKIENHFGKPQDVEWAIEHNKIFITQTRPITALPNHIEWQASVPGLWLRHFRLGEWLGEPVTPLFETWLLEQLEERIYANFERAIQLPNHKPYHTIVNGWYFTSGNFLPKNISNLIWLGLRYMIPAMILRPQQLSILFVAKAHWGMKFYEREWRESIAPSYQRVVETGESQIEKSGNSKLAQIIDSVAKAAGDNFYSFIAVGGSAWKPEMMLAKFYRKHLFPVIGGSHLNLLKGMGTKEIIQNKHAVLSLDWFHPTLGELNVNRKIEKEQSKKTNAESERLKSENAARDCLQIKPRLLSDFNKQLTIAQASAVVREEQIATLTLGWPLMRQAIMKLGNYFMEHNFLENAEDIFFATRQEVADLISRDKSDETLLKNISDRQRKWQRERNLTPPSIIGNMSFFAKRIFNGIDKSFGINPEKPEGNILKGIPASSGMVTGPVRIIRTPEEFERLNPGDILVAHVTNPAWTPLFANAAGVITEIGNIMAHTSLVAREYGIPAIIGAIDATSRLRDGSIVTMNGNTGIIHLEVKI